MPSSYRKFEDTGQYDDGSSCVSLTILILLPIVFAVAAYFWADAQVNGWLSPWQTLPNPPEKVARIAAISGISLWIQGVSGAIYANMASDSCQSDCWVVVAAVPAIPPGPYETLAHTCVGPPALMFITQSLAECRREQWADSNTLYALRSDGRLVAWRFESGMEYITLNYYCWPGGALIVGLILAVIIVVGRRAQQA